MRRVEGGAADSSGASRRRQVRDRFLTAQPLAKTMDLRSWWSFCRRDACATKGQVLWWRMRERMELMVAHASRVRNGVRCTRTEGDQCRRDACATKSLRFGEVVKVALKAEFYGGAGAPPAVAKPDTRIY